MQLFQPIKLQSIVWLKYFLLDGFQVKVRKWFAVCVECQRVFAKGSSPAEVLGIDYKSMLKPALDSFGDDINKSSMSKLEELISLQQQSVENAAKIEAKEIVWLHFNPVVMK